MACVAPSVALAPGGDGARRVDSAGSVVICAGRESSVVLGREDVVAAQDRIRGFVRRTPTLAASGPDQVWLKCEFLQHCGVFKTRGAFNRQLAARERGELDPSIGVVVASGGNAGLANAYAARQLGVPAAVFVPAAAPAVKVQRIAAYGAHVHRIGA